jgi:hypothetical protein
VKGDDMAILQSIRSRRALAGGIALAAGTAAIAAPAVAPPLAANPLNDADVSPSVNGDSGTYESCTAMFGLTTKETASYVTFAVEGAAAPLPGIGDGLTAVLTVDDGSSAQECMLEEGFASEAEWFEYLGGAPGPIAADGFPYPGVPGYLVPNFGAFTTDSVAPVSVAPTLTLRVEATDPTLSVTSSPTDIGIVPPSGEDVILDIADELGGPTSPLGGTYLDYVDGGGCVNDDPEIIALTAALIPLTGVPQAVFNDLSIFTCDQLLLATQLRVGQLFFAPLGTGVSVTVDRPTPGPAPTPAPAPVTPSFTG